MPHRSSGRDCLAAYCPHGRSCAPSMGGARATICARLDSRCDLAFFETRTHYSRGGLATWTSISIWHRIALPPSLQRWRDSWWSSSLLTGPDDRAPGEYARWPQRTRLVFDWAKEQGSGDMVRISNFHPKQYLHWLLSFPCVGWKWESADLLHFLWLQCFGY